MSLACERGMRFMSLSLLLCVACGGGGGATPAVTDLQISRASIENNATDTPLNQEIAITFSDTVDEESLTSDNIFVKPINVADGTADICTEWTLDTTEMIATCTHGDFAPGISYVIIASVRVQSSGGTSLVEPLATIFTTVATSTDNTPEAMIVIPSFDSVGTTTFSLRFTKAIADSSLTTESVAVTTEDSTTNLCADIAVADDGLTATCTTSTIFKCTDEPTKYNVALNADIRSLDSGAALKPYTGYFTNIDDGFGNADTMGPCWYPVDGSDNEGLPNDDEIKDIDVVNDGRLTIQGDGDVDLTGPSDIFPEVSKGNFNIGGPWALTSKLDILSGMPGDNASNLSLVLGVEDSSNYLSIVMKGNSGATEYQSVSGVDGVTYLGEEETGCADCANIDSTRPVYICFVVDENNVLDSISVDEGGSGSFTNISLPSTIASLADLTRISFGMWHNANGTPLAVVDWIRFNIGEASCPSISDVE